MVRFFGRTEIRPSAFHQIGNSSGSAVVLRPLGMERDPLLNRRGVTVAEIEGLIKD